MTSYIDPPIPDAIRRIAHSGDLHLAWEFFVFFSRYEYALKRVDRYLMPGEGNAEANWDRFASDYNTQFNPQANLGLAAAVSYYLGNPPRKQLRDDGEMKWSDPLAFQQNEPLLIWLLRSVRVVRNNLFHGGKFPLTSVSEPSRNRELLASAITILSACLALDQQVSNFLVADGDG